jgi:GTPase SAR1 family protein
MSFIRMQQRYRGLVLRRLAPNYIMITARLSQGYQIVNNPGKIDAPSHKKLQVEYKKKIPVIALAGIFFKTTLTQNMSLYYLVICSL